MTLPYILSITRTADRDAFIRYMEEHGIKYEALPNLLKYFRVDEGFNHPDIRSFDPEDKEVKGSARIDLSITSPLLEGGWHLARVIRRSLPYSIYRFEGDPVETFYDAARTGSGVDVYVVDSGIVAGLAEFSGRATSIHDAVGGSGVDGYGHGTAVAGLAAGITTGTAHDSLIWSARALDNSGGGTIATTVECLDEVLAHYLSRAGTDRPAVLNMSLGFTTTGLNAAIEDIVEAGMVVCAAADNDHRNLETNAKYPARTDGVICVGGTNGNDRPYYNFTSGTNYSREYVDILAPGQSIKRLGLDGSPGYGNGTSYACAIASGIVACMLQGHSRLTTAAETRQLLVALNSQATTGKLVVDNATPSGVLPDRILYLDPTLTTEDITPPVINFVAGSVSTYLTSTTTIDVTVPSPTAGDLILIAVMHDSALTPPGGLTHVDTQANASGRSISVYSKVSVGSETTLTFTQSGAGRMGTHASVFRSSDGSDLGAVAFAANQTTGEVVTMPIPPLAMLGGELGYCVSLCQALITGGGNAPCSVSSPWLLASSQSVPENRMSVGYRYITGDNVTAGSATFNTTGTVNFAGINCRISPVTS